MRKYLFLLIFQLIFSASAFCQYKVAVYVSGDNVDEAVKKVFGQKLVTAITKNPQFKAYERSDEFVNALSQVGVENESYGMNDQQLLNLAKSSGMDYVAAVDITELFGEYFAMSRLIEMGKNGVVASYESSGAIGSVPELTRIADNIADGLILEPLRKELRKKAEAERLAREEQAEYELRQQAIRNLTPAGCEILGQYAFKFVTSSVKVSENGKELYLSYQRPVGFKMADQNVVGQLVALGLNLYDKNYVVVSNTFIPFGNPQYGTSWDVLCYYWSNGNYCGTFGVCDTVWEKKKNVIRYQYPTNVIVYQNAPSESQIQAEMSRLRLFR